MATPASHGSPGRPLHAAGALRFVAGAVLVLAACGGDPEAPPADRAAPDRPQRSIVEMAQVAGQFSTLLAAVEAAGLTQTLQEDGPFTVFAPTDGAFSDLPPGTVDALLEDPDGLRAVLLHHVVPGRLSAQELRGLSSVETVGGGELGVAVTERGITVEGVYMLTADVGASNGVIHVITSVLTP
jgi:transforming growth factor-beta-induced protein